MRAAQVDLVSAEAKEKVLASIRQINSSARIIECQLNSSSMSTGGYGGVVGRPRLEEVVGTNSFSVQRALEVGDCNARGGAPGCWWPGS